VLPLRRFAQLLARQARDGTARTPRRLQRRPAPPLDMLRVFRADHLWYKGYRDLYRDYPRELWDTPYGAARQPRAAGVAATDAVPPAAS